MREYTEKEKEEDDTHKEWLFSDYQNTVISKMFKQRQ